ncbi:type VI secretion system protein TssA [Caulobacter sp. S45]|uniref:type VI secretion system protein TssA n=1 Tax=Caulobacter sp. S45 TaxID=1641861 RepID=UPI00157618EB|nr:type VI secretion system protein TssA [Caulobacter sp. S45]
MDEHAFDLEPLLAPQAGDVAEADLRSGGGGGVFFRLKDLRSEARAAERDAVSAPDSETPVIQAGLRQWTELAELAEGALQAHAKDLEIACWLCEAWVRLEGFAGLNRGLELVLKLVELYWDAGLQPVEDEDGPVARAAPVGALLGFEGIAALLQPIRLLPLSDHAPEVALWTVETAFAPLQGGEDAVARERMQARRTEQVEQVRQAVLRASDAFLRSVHGQAGAAADRVEALSAMLDARTGMGRFGSQLIQPLRSIVTLIEDQAGGRLADAEPVGDDQAGGADGMEGAAPSSGVARGRVASRAEAYDAILRIADFFAETEPQSLVARSLREVVRRGRLPLEDLLGELIPDAAERTLFLQRAGVKDETAADNQNNY